MPEAVWLLSSEGVTQRRPLRYGFITFVGQWTCMPPKRTPRALSFSLYVTGMHFGLGLWEAESHLSGHFMTATGACLKSCAWLHRRYHFNVPCLSSSAFLPDFLDRGAFFAVKVYLAAVSACHVVFHGKPALAALWGATPPASHIQKAHPIMGSVDFFR